MEHLATYGTLAPGEKDHWLVRNIAGEWRTGTVLGWAYPFGFGPADGYPGFSSDPDGAPVEVAVLSSDRLDGHWREIDDFEGPGYRRIEVDVTLSDDTVLAQTVLTETVLTAWIFETNPNAE